MENRACLLPPLLCTQTRSHHESQRSLARSHAALTQRLAANLAWQKHGLQLNGGSDAAPRTGRGEQPGRATPHHGPPPPPAPKKPRGNGRLAQRKRRCSHNLDSGWNLSSGFVVWLSRKGLPYQWFHFSLASALCSHSDRYHTYRQ